MHSIYILKEEFWNIFIYGLLFIDLQSSQLHYEYQNIQYLIFFSSTTVCLSLLSQYHSRLSQLPSHLSYQDTALYIQSYHSQHAQEIFILFGTQSCLYFIIMNKLRPNQSKFSVLKTFKITDVVSIESMTNKKHFENSGEDWLLTLSPF